MKNIQCYNEREKSSSNNTSAQYSPFRNVWSPFQTEILHL